MSAIGTNQHGCRIYRTPNVAIFHWLILGAKLVLEEQEGNSGRTPTGAAIGRTPNRDKG